MDYCRYQYFFAHLKLESSYYMYTLKAGRMSCLVIRPIVDHHWEVHELAAVSK